MKCKIDGCTKVAKGRGWCSMHYRRWRQHGDPLVTLTPHRGQDAEGRYEALVDRITTPDGCHPWTGALTQRWSDQVVGYGRLFVDGHQVYAHRWGYEHYIGSIPDVMQIRHTCDNPPCQNRDHWVLGTAADNMQDRSDRERQARGERHGVARLTAAEVLAIREEYAAGGVTQEALGEKYGITQGHIGEIIRRTSWKHI